MTELSSLPPNLRDYIRALGVMEGVEPDDVLKPNQRIGRIVDLRRKVLNDIANTRTEDGRFAYATSEIAGWFGISRQQVWRARSLHAGYQSRHKPAA